MIKHDDTPPTTEQLREAVEAGKGLGRIRTTYDAVAIARRHMREAEERRDKALAEGNTHAGLVYARQAQTADAIAREIEGAANDR